MAEKRKLKRRQLIYYLQVLDRRTGLLVGRLADITTEGLMLISPDPIEENKEIELRMVLPAEIQGDKAVVFDAQSVWCRKDVNPDLYVTGFRFLKVAARDFKIIDDLILDYEIPN
jgi:c-di-GMP-binding flagellar brake protein YcgR